MSNFKEKITEIKDKVVEKGNEAIDNIKKDLNSLYNAVDTAKDNFDDPNYFIKKSS